MKRLTAVLIVLSALSFVQKVHAASCLAVFPEALSSYSGTGEIYFAADSVVYGTDTILDISIAQDLSNRSCETTSCTSSGNTSQDFLLPAFLTTSSSEDINVSENASLQKLQGDYDNVVVGRNSVLTFADNNTESRITRLEVAANADLVLAAGIYWIDSLIMAENTKLVVPSGEKVTLYVTDVDLSDNVELNYDGAEQQLVMTIYNDFISVENTKMRGFLYVQNELSLGDFSKFFGALNAQTIRTGEASRFYTRLANIESADFDNLCSQNNSLPEPVAYYSMDMCSLSVGNANIEDSSGNNDGSSTTGVSPEYSGKNCQAAKFDGGEAFIDIPDAVFDNLSQGSISLYFNTPDLTHSSDASYGAMALFSRDASGYQSQGHVSVWISDTGGIIARQQNANTSITLSTSASNFQQNQWHHVVHTWGSDGMRTYTDGQLRLSYPSYTGGFADGGPDMALGANAWFWQSSNANPRSSQLKDFFLGSIDELRIYDEQLSASQVDELASLNAQQCINCFTPVELVAHWGADVCSFDANQLVDVVNGLNATLQNGISSSPTSRFCQGLIFDGNQSYATVTHNELFEIEDGAISLWFKLEDLEHSNNGYAGGNALLSKDTRNYGTEGHVDIRVDQDAKVQVRHQANGRSYYFASPALIEENRWHHLVYSFGSLGVKLYVDGELQDSDSTFTSGWGDNVEVLAFGATGRLSTLTGTSSNNFRDFLLGELDDIKLYKNQPSDADVASWYTQETSDCLTCSTLLGEYKFDQDDPQSSRIEDTSGNNTNGILGSELLSSIISENVSCRALETSTASGNEPDYYFDTTIEGEDIGSQGSISFWYQSKDQWNDGDSRQIFDATNDSNSKYLFMVKRSDGSIRFGLETDDDNDLIFDTSSNNISAQTWVHIAVTWNLLAKEYHIYFDGVSQALNFVNDELVNDDLPDLGSLVFGDNRTSYRVNGSSGNASNAYFDDIRVYSQVISSTQVQADMAEAESCVLVDHYLIEHPTTALTCDSPSLVVKACANANCDSLANVPTTITLSPNIFEGSSTATFTGQTTFTFNNRSAGTFTLSSTSQEPIAPIACDSSDCEIVYEGVGVQFFNTQNNDSQFTNFPFVASSNLSALGIRIVGSDSGGACESVTSDTQDISLTYECVQTSGVDYTPSMCNVPFAGIVLSGGTRNSGTLSVAFDENGEADFANYNFADASLLRLTASATVDGASVLADTAELKIIPDKLLIETSTSTVNTAAENFTFEVKALGANGAVLPGYQANRLQVSAKRVIPNSASGTDAQFVVDTDSAITTSLAGNFQSIDMEFSLGMASSTTAYMEEVGTYILSAQDADYLGQIISADSLQLGRFIPAYFDVTKVHQPLFENSCSNFTNVGEEFGFTPGLQPSFEVTALNALGRVTNNYADSLWTLLPSAATMANQESISDSAPYSQEVVQVNDLASVTISGQEIFNGKATITANGYTFKYPKVASPSGADASPFASSVEITMFDNWFSDADNVCYQTSYPSACAGFTLSNISGANLRYSRLNIANAFGPENEPLSVPIFTEYLDGGQWRVNQDDNCTLVDVQQSDNEMSFIHDAQSTNNIASLVSGTSISALMSQGVLAMTNTQFGPYIVDGQAVLGSFYMELLPKSEQSFWSSYLNYDWDGDGDIDADDKPSASVNFGVYRGNERTLHWREVLN